MSVNRILRIREGDALERLRDFLFSWWSRIEFGAMLVPILQPGGTEVASQAIKDPACLSAFNPFAPVMLSNTAAAMDRFLRDHLQGPLAILLRPCELRTLIELQKRRRILPPSLGSKEKNGIVLIGVDCPGTLTAEEFARQVEASGIEAVTREALSSGNGCGFPHERLRVACQLCDWPTPIGADLAIGMFGALNRQSLLLISKDDVIDARLGLADLTDGLATEEDIFLRGNAIKSLLETRIARRESLSASGGPKLDTSSSLLGSLTRCTLCADCLDACPLYEGELSGLLGVGGPRQYERPLLAELISISRWLASCSGCGMCEEVCEWDIPLTMMISLFSRTICEELGYTAGEPGQRLPW
jgi:formate dehydrogenase subunit beta